MSKIQEYYELSRNVRVARAFLKTMEREVTSCHDVYDLNSEEKLDNCINKFNRIKLPNGQIQDESTVLNCEHLFGNQVFCDQWGCDMSKQINRCCYLKVKQELDEAIVARRAFVCGLLKREK